MREQNLERELDAALARYADVEPRDGLEQRVLANLRAQDRRATRFGWGRLAAAGFAAASLAALTLWVGERHSPRLNPGPQPAQHEMSSTSAQVSVPTATEIPSERERTNRRRPQSYLAGRNARGNADTVPKLAQFPAPQPLTQQEKLLIRFVEQDPEDAVLVAQQARERLRQETEAMEGSGIDTSDEQQVQ